MNAQQPVRRRRRPLSPKWVLRFVLTGLLCLVVGFGLGFLTGAFYRPAEAEPPETIPTFPSADVVIVDTTPQEEPYVLTINTIEDILRPASDLVSMKYCYTDADTYENYKELFGQRIPFTTDKVVFTYDGVVSVGIDLSQVRYEIDNDAKTIRIQVPELHVISNSIDKSSFAFPYESDSLFNASGMEEYVALIDTLEKQKEKDVMANEEFIRSAEENTRLVLRTFLTASSATQDYQVIFDTISQ